MRTVGEHVLDEIIRQSMVRVAHPDPDTDHVFVWNANTIDQLDAAIKKAVRKCEHPASDRMRLGEHYEWCAICGAVKRDSWMRWDCPNVV